MKKVKAVSALLFFQLVFIGCQKDEKKTSISRSDTSNDSVKITKPVDEIDYKDFNIFNISSMSSIGNNQLMDLFISVSDIYSDPHSVPEEFIKNQKQKSFEQLQYLELDAPHRKRMLDGIHLTENDSLYMYNYEFNQLQKIPVKKLKAAAYLDVYATEGEEVDAGSYMLGFQIEANKSITDHDRYNNVIAYFGNKNPFIENKMKPIQWKKADAQISRKYFPDSKLKYGETHQARYENLTYYLQDLIENENVLERRLVVMNDHNEKIFENSFSIAGSDGAEFSPLNGINSDEANQFQWTGRLFKGKPPVIFGLISPSFGCPSIVFLDKKEKAMTINCDNRH
ncbi:hypothetical protein F3J23_12550 [Chryseobacterium sp. Tr-659]|uniref:hypothetical protein n=1 Tax=Chryseobacterium sp. Tr-659 TaxID=2608340 RepID=UPI00141E1550|nr:hypothetical protein [Chryseobacterium sp. Tr-659]NIF06269.1 hypothetical protein [Chryseobacterium sp. Tr-659]